MKTQINPQSKADTVEIQKHGDGFKVLVLKDDVIVNFFHADDPGVAVGIARKQMERFG